MAALLATVLTEGQLSDWGWRVPFLLTLPMGLVALGLRLRLEETPPSGTREDGSARPGARSRGPSSSERGA